MCKGKTACTCSRHDGPRLHVELSSGEVQAVRYQGRDHIVVPVIMAQDDVVMNDHLYPASEFFPEAWNGVPVTVQHPSKDGTHVSANEPHTLNDYAIGRIFYARNADGKLVAEAWVDVARANEVAPGLVASIIAGDQIDVSTGFFSDVEEASGEVNGKQYQGIHRNVRPDHLAFLPGVEGACNWNDGCGIRSNKMKLNEKAASALKAMLASIKEFVAVGEIIDNARSPSSDSRQQIADLVSHDDAPFTADDMGAMHSLSGDTLKRLHDQYCSDMSTNAATESDVKKEEIEAIVQATVANAIKAAMADTVAALKANAAPALSAEDKAAIDGAKAIVAEKRNGLIGYITANSSMTKEQATAMPDATLEIFAAALPKPAAPTYMGRPAPMINADESAISVAKDMIPAGVVAHFKARGSKKEAA